MTHEEWEDRCTMVEPGLYVGEVAVRAEEKWLYEVGIDAVVSILTKEQAAEWNTLAPVGKHFKHQTFNFGDRDKITPAQMDAILGSCGKMTLLHCISGANRSTAIALCWLVDRGYTIVGAFRRYYASRGMAAAKVYAAVPRLTEEMANNVENWLRSKGKEP